VRAALLWNLRLLLERAASASLQRRRTGKLRRSVARGLEYGHLESLELLEIAKPLGIGEIYDIGANVGSWTLLAKAVNPDARIHAFEPLATHADRFERRIAEIRGAQLHRVALGRDNVTARMRVTNHSDSSSLLPVADAGRAHFGLAEVGQTITTVRRLDDYRAERALPLPDLIKLDVQGYELEVLAGGVGTLESAKAIIVEASFTKVNALSRRFAASWTLTGFRREHSGCRRRWVRLWCRPTSSSCGAERKCLRLPSAASSSRTTSINRALE